MKRFLAVALICALSFAACSGGDTWKPEHASDELKPYIERAIEIIDEYLAFDISAEEADAAFSELVDRLEPLGVMDADSSYSLVDQSAALTISKLTYGERNDLEYRQIRDILAYQIGGKVSGRAFPVENEFNIFEDEIVHQAIQEYDAPASLCMVSELGEKRIDISLHFDAINGIAPSDLLSYTNTLVDIVSEISSTSSESKFHIHVAYLYYNQTVFGLHLDFEGTTVTGYLNKPVGRIMDFESVDEIAGAVEAGAKYFGNHNVPTGRPTASEDTNITENTTATGAEVDIAEYPSAIGTDTEKLLIPIFPDEIFKSTAEENGLAGTLYKVYGTVTSITADSSGNMTELHLRTYKGNVVISNSALAMASDQSLSELGTINESTIEALCPMPKEGELCCIFAEYQGFSEKYKTPYFIYGSEDYLTEVLLAAIEFE